VLQAGERAFGENRVQEAAAKWPGLRADHPQLRLHLIGPLQTNKAAAAVALFDAIQTVDREKLARSLAAEMEKQNRRPDCFIQVNTGAEPQKAGIALAAADEFIRLCREELSLPVVGLMCIPPAEQDPAPHFSLLAALARRNRLAFLSMGMSGDFEIAIRHGATHVRVGSAIFGDRPAPPAG
jgi:PLP dependent protein